MKKYIFETFKGKNGDWYFHLKASNGNIIASSEGYKTKATMKRVINSLMKHLPAEICN
jgi:uncharacterized protein YegP (UPF0339 family)